MNLQVLKLVKIKPYWRNPRQHEKTIPALKESITRFGYNVPLVIDKKHVIICGHARYKALQQLGYTETTCVISEMDEKQAKAYRLADNKIQEQSTWKMDDFVLELRDLPDVGELQIFFEDFDIDTMLAESSGGKVHTVLQEDIDKTAEKLGQVRPPAERTSVICPHCAEEFFI